MNILTIHEPDTVPRRLRFSDPEVKRASFETEYAPGPWDLVVRWGLGDKYDLDRNTVLNPAWALRNIQDPRYVVELLRAHGIRTGYMRHVLGRAPRIPRYRLHVCDMRVISTTRLAGGGGSAKRMRNVREMARRVAYSLGLHFAAVEVGVIGRHEAVPISIDPTPTLTPRLGKRYADAVTEYGKRRMERLTKKPRPIVLGADPEFMILRSGREIVYASRYLPYRGRVGHDEQPSKRNRRLRPIAEIRPAPTADPAELVERIRRLLKVAMRRTPRRGVRWVAGSAPVSTYPIGGHIHFTDIRLTTELIRALDNYLALPLVMIENAERSRLRRPKYGYLGDIRWGRHGGFEYRVPSSWIVAPSYALAVLTLARLVASNYERLTRNIFTTPEYCRMFYAADGDGLRMEFEEAWSDLESLPDYHEVAAELEVIPDLVRQNKRWMESRDLRVRWGLISPPRRRRRR